MSIVAFPPNRYTPLGIPKITAFWAQPTKTDAALRKVSPKSSLFETSNEAFERRLSTTPATVVRRRVRRIEVTDWTVEIGKNAYPVRNWNQQGFLSTPCELVHEVGDLLDIRFSALFRGGGIEDEHRARVVRIDRKRRELAAVFIAEDEA